MIYPQHDVYHVRISRDFSDIAVFSKSSAILHFDTIAPRLLGDLFCFNLCINSLV